MARERTTDWNNIADWYDKLVGESGSEYHREVVLPGALRLLGAQAGQHVLDIACGQGVLCRLLAERGVRATGVDASRELIAAARERNSVLSPQSSSLLNFQLGDARDLSFLPQATFDSAACILAIQNIHPIQGVFNTVARALRPQGRFVVVMMDPHFRGPKETSWGWDEKQKIQYRRVDRYLVPRKTPIVTNPGKSAMVYTWSFHKPLEAYVKAAVKAGLLIDALEEWPSHKTSTSGPRAAAENTSRKEIPMFLALRAKKVASPAPLEQAAEQPAEDADGE